MLRLVLIVTLFVNLMACSSTPEWKGVYSSDEKKVNTKLEVPPDLSQPDVTGELDVPNIAAGDSTYSAYTNTEYKAEKVISADPKGVKVIRDGANQWLEINASAEKLWPELKVFFTEVGFEIKREDKALGVIETNWLENRIDAPTITHQGLKESATDDNSTNVTFKIWWETRPSDPELEAEMYQRFLIFRDVDKADALKIVKKINAKERTHLIQKEGTNVLQVGEEFARTWRRVGIALDRIGLLVEDRNRSAGLYYLRITDDFRSKVIEEENWLSSMFSSDKVKLKERYLLSVSEENNNSIISVYETTGAKADVDFVKKLLTNLKTYLD
jgi:outer membrane protein assembly factor BamC